MLAGRNRVTSAPQFTAAVRSGRPAGTRTLVVHVGTSADAERPAASAAATSGASYATTTAPPRVGFVVGRAVGNAVTRNRVRRRLRELARGRLARLPDDALVVVRALPGAATATYAGLGSDLDRALARVLPASGADPAGPADAGHGPTGAPQERVAR